MPCLTNETHSYDFSAAQRGRDQRLLGAHRLLERARRSSRGLLAGLLALGASASCAAPTGNQAEQPQVTSAALDQEMLNAALDEQHSLESAGVSLKTRAWLKADAYVAEYHTANGTFLGTQRIGKNSVLRSEALPRIVQGESFSEFAKRANAESTMPVSGMAKDEVWFKPDPIASHESKDVAVASADLSTLEQVAQALAQCDSMARTSCLSNTVGYTAPGWPLPATISNWAVTFGGSLASHGSGGSITGSDTDGAWGHGSAAFAAVCARSVAATLSMKISNPRFGFLSASSFSLTAQPLVFLGVVVGEGWSNRACPFLSAQCNYRVDFNQADISFNAAPGNNLQTFCGQITDEGAIFFDRRCNAALGTDCPSFDFPSAFTASSVSN
jgi:hypothetical protein